MSRCPVRLIRAFLACALLVCPALAARLDAQQVVDGFKVTDAQCSALPELDRRLQAIDSCKKGATAKPRAIRSCMTWWKGWPAACMAPPTCTAQVDAYYAHLTGAMSFADRTRIFKTAGLATAVNGQIRNSCAVRKPAASTTPKPPAEKPPPFKTGLGDEVDKLVAKSPTLVDNLKKLAKKKVTIKLGVAGDGTYWDGESIVIDPKDKDDPSTLLTSLAHETSHALYKQPYRIKWPWVSRDEWIDRNTTESLKNEGEATMMNIKVLDELHAAGVKIAIAGNPANHKKYRDIYDKYPRARDRDKAISEIGEIFRHGETPSGDANAAMDYEAYYKQQWADIYDGK